MRQGTRHERLTGRAGCGYSRLRCRPATTRSSPARASPWLDIFFVDQHVSLARFIPTCKPLRTDRDRHVPVGKNARPSNIPGYPLRRAWGLTAIKWPLVVSRDSDAAQGSLTRYYGIAATALGSRYRSTTARLPWIFNDRYLPTTGDQPHIPESVPVHPHDDRPVIHRSSR